MSRLTTLIISTLFLISCDDNKEEVFECPDIIEPVIISAVRINFFDANKVSLNICDVIVTIDNPDLHETLYGSGESYNCEERFSLGGGYNLVEHDVLIEKAGFLNQEFKGLLPTQIQCGYEPFELNVYLEVN